jgi:putative FmdB family regulatory protein
VPIYEFDCYECQESFEKLVRVSGKADEIICPVCGSRQVKKKLSLFAATLTGSRASTGAPSSCSSGGG